MIKSANSAVLALGDVLQGVLAGCLPGPPAAARGGRLLPSLVPELLGGCHDCFRFVVVSAVAVIVV